MRLAIPLADGTSRGGLEKISIAGRRRTGLGRYQLPAGSRGAGPGAGIWLRSASWGKQGPSLLLSSPR
jgi:hypothetical protein